VKLGRDPEDQGETEGYARVSLFSSVRRRSWRLGILGCGSFQGGGIVEDAQGLQVVGVDWWIYAMRCGGGNVR